jgi:hypothetical protein
VVTFRQVRTTPAPGAPDALPARTRLPGGPKPAEGCGWIQIVRAVAFDVLNVAVQLRAAFMVTVPSAQSASPLQEANTEPAAAVAVRLTTVPGL